MRALQKRKYTEVTLRELQEYPKRFSNDDWENTHQENFFYHLAGAVEAMLLEICDKYGLEIALNQIDWKSVDNTLKNKKMFSPAFDYLAKFRQTENDWLSLLVEWRNHGTHRHRINKVINLSTRESLDNEFIDPRTGKPQMLYPNYGCLKIIEMMYSNVCKLLILVYIMQ
jgi:hypothetical protein